MIPRIKIIFHHIVHDTQECASPDRRATCRVIFSLSVDEKIFGEFYADVRHRISNTLVAEPIEVGPPVGYHDVFNQREFSKQVTRYLKNRMIENTAHDSDSTPPFEVTFEPETRRTSPTSGFKPDPFW
jgi:hypothetical protein